MRRAFRTILACSTRLELDARCKALGRRLEDGDVETVTRLLAEEGARYTGADYARAIVIVHRVGRDLARFLERYDLFLSPTLAQPPWPLGAVDMMGDDLDRYFDSLDAHMPFTGQFNMSGQPAASLPLHWSEDGLPIGVQFAARFGDEATLLRLSAQLEAARPWTRRRPPLTA